MINKDLCMQKVDQYRTQGFTWPEIATLLNNETDNNLSPSAYRMAYYDYTTVNPQSDRGANELQKHDQLTWAEVLSSTDFTPMPIDDGGLKISIGSIENDALEQVKELKMEKMKLADYRSEVNRMYRRMSREETIKEIAKDAAEVVAKEKPFVKITNTEEEPIPFFIDKAAILCLSDWHYGSVQDSYYNKYDPDICKQRLNVLVNEVINRLNKNGFTTNHHLYIVNLGDLVNGLIHAQIRINNRIDVITQIMEVSEILAEIIDKLAGRYKIHYVSTMDNHSRVMPDKKDSMDLESLCRITDWYIKERCKNLDVIFEDHVFGDDIATFEVLGHNVIAAHGDKDKPTNIIKNLTVHTRKPYDLMLSAHRHHFSCDEENDCVLVCNGSVMGTDDYAQSLRLNSRASQTLIISTCENAVDTLYKINLN